MSLRPYNLHSSLCSLLLFCCSVSFANPCPRSLDNAYSSRDGDGFYYVVDFPKSAVQAKPHSQFYALLKLQENVKAKTSVDPIVLLEKQLRFYLKIPHIRKRFEKIINQEIGKVRSINCLESFLYDSHLKRFKRASEFQAFAYSKKGSDKVRILVTSQNSLSSVSSGSRVLSLRASYPKKGWLLNSHLHNHPFSFDNPYGDVAGTIIPSEPDASTYRALRREEGLKQALLTNGISTFVLKGAEIHNF